ncbi:GSCFA domain-containing protein [Nisaea acidiphila]|uniref:GSCFA domain-containing protein n=1 Tax=Nisaea acidiphila TaxID=1862145 RepID=A0A9J7AWX2_9PROT|nr:GSCFA domain-containing protein [Nisaea acidiphila]UUX51863.1 GSCFA domain-containing protein [Nisaea acidiphila]
MSAETPPEGNAPAPSAELQKAIEFINSGHLDLAQEQLRNIVRTSPDDVRSILLLVEVSDRLKDKDEAAELLDNLLSRAQHNAHLLYRRGLVALGTDPQQLSKANEADHYFEKAIAADPGMVAAHLHRGLALKRQTWQVEGIPHYKRTLLLVPELTVAAYELARSQFLAEDLTASKNNLRRTLVLEPGHPSARKDLEDLEEVLRNARIRQRGIRFPNNLDDMQDARAALRKHILSPSYPKILNSSTKVATFGSCFAANIARTLRSLGVKAGNTTMGEYVNSTFANRHYIDWAVNGADNEVTRGIVDFHAGDLTFSANREDHLKTLAESDIIIMTVGVAPCFFRRDTGELVMPRQSNFNLRALLRDCESRMTTVDENAENIRFIVRQIRKINSEATMVITISPVPLNATFEYDSAIVADCVSKSTLRVSVDQVMRGQFDKLLYWPSFEVVRWLGAYAPGMYGEDDGSTIHISERAIGFIVEAFVEQLSGGELSLVNAGD